jgi:hypothetical protein
MAKKVLDLDPAEILFFPFQDEAWIKKFLIASALVFFSFIPVIPLVLLLGYAGEIIRRIARTGESPSLPEWDDLGGYFNEGIRLFGVGAVYLLPAVVLIGIGYLAMFVPLILVESGALSEAQATGLIIAGYIAAFGLMGVGALISMLTGLILPVAGAHAVVEGDFQAAFKFKQLWSLFKANWGGFAVAYLILIGAAMVLYYGAYFLAATVILCCLYPFALCFMSAYLVLIGAGLFGSAYRKAKQTLPAAK